MFRPVQWIPGADLVGGPPTTLWATCPLHPVGHLTIHHAVRDTALRVRMTTALRVLYDDGFVAACFIQRWVGRGAHEAMTTARATYIRPKQASTRCGAGPRPRLRDYDDPDALRVRQRRLQLDRSVPCPARPPPPYQHSSRSSPVALPGLAIACKTDRVIAVLPQFLR